MKKNWQYLKYIARHKWFVLVAGLKFKVSWWRLLIHDYSKFMPVEWTAYREFFYGERTPAVKAAFKKAWLHHIHINKHHWNHWTYNDTDGTSVLEMPDKYIREMLADWFGAGRAIQGKWCAWDWYAEHESKICLHENTRGEVERLLKQANF